MNEQERVAKFIEEFKALEETYGVEVYFSTFTDRMQVKDKESQNDYEIEWR